MSTLSLGIDPGKINLGYALVEQVGIDKDTSRPLIKTVTCGVLSLVQKDKVVEDLLIELIVSMEKLGFRCHLHPLVVERYAAYAGVSTSETEHITSTIGILRGIYALKGDNFAILFRAIDWKTKLVKELNMKFKFENPSLKLDKKFSLAAGKFLVTNPELIKTDHEADSICLASMPILFPTLGQSS